MSIGRAVERGSVPERGLTDLGFTDRGVEDRGVAARGLGVGVERTWSRGVGCGAGPLRVGQRSVVRGVARGDAPGIEGAGVTVRVRVPGYWRGIGAGCEDRGGACTRGEGDVRGVTDVGRGETDGRGDTEGRGETEGRGDTDGRGEADGRGEDELGRGFALGRWASKGLAKQAANAITMPTMRVPIMKPLRRCVGVAPRKQDTISAHADSAWP